MKKFCNLYFSPEFGYIVTSSAKQKGSAAFRVVPPVIFKDTNTSISHLGKAILEGMEKTFTSEPVEVSEVKDYKFWDITGIKSYNTFNKKFRYIKITETNSSFVLVEYFRQNSGGYAQTDESPKKELPLGSTAENLGQAIFQMLNIEPKKDTSDIAEFTTLNDRRVVYTLPSEKFVDLGDGHTDAYQIYALEEDEDTYIAFIIDNGYRSLEDEDIKIRWKQMYSTMTSFEQQKAEDSIVFKKIFAATPEKEIYSFLIKDEPGCLEVMVSISTGDVDTAAKVKSELFKVVESIKICS